MLFCRIISTAGCVPSAELCTCIPSCYANVSSGTSLHRHTTCIFWGNSNIYITSQIVTQVTPNNIIVRVLSGFKPVLFFSSDSADIPAQICASTSGAWSGASDVLSLPWCSDVHAHAATNVCWACGPKCPHGLLSDGSRVPPWLNSDGGQRLWCWCSLHSRQQCFHPSEYPPAEITQRN